MGDQFNILDFKKAHRNDGHILLKHPLAIHVAQNQRYTTENENVKTWV